LSLSLIHKYDPFSFLLGATGFSSHQPILSRIGVMDPPKVGFNSYVDIATSMVIHDSCCKRSQESVSGWADKDFEINTPDLLKLEWSKRIEEWQRLYPDRGPPVEDCASLKDLKFHAFFLQHPIAAMSLWNVMQTFYALDRFVCCTSKESRDKIAEWESMPLFEYLEASRVEKRWRSSLQNLRKEIKDENNRDALLPRIDGMLLGTVKLEDACKELQRSLKENLKGVKLVDLILEQISVAAGRRFSMIDTYLKMDENHNEETNIDDVIEDATESGMLSLVPI
jgi:hypothetical protein